MDPRSWTWKRRSPEKNFLSEKSSSLWCKYDEQMQKLHTEKSEIERDNRLLIEKLSSALADCNAKDNVVREQVKIAEEAITGWEKAETEAIFMKQKLDQVLRQKIVSDERICQLEAALKECAQQGRIHRDKEEVRDNGEIIRKSEEFEKIRIGLEEKLAYVCKKICISDAENTQLCKVLTEKDKMIENLSKQRDLMQAEFNGLKLKVESSEKETASLKYKFLALEKELELRDEEKGFSRRMADLAQKKHQESVKKTAKLQTECQGINLLAGKRFPVPASTKMRTEISMPGRNLVETRRRKSNSSEAQEQRKKILEDSLNHRSRELQFSRSMYARTSSRLSHGEGQTATEPGQCFAFSQEHSLTCSSDVGIDDKATYSESWASALISELEHFKNVRQSEAPSLGTSSINLIDDFAEMEKLAVVSVDYPAGSSQHSSEDNNARMGTSKSPSVVNSSSEPGRLANLLKMLLEYSYVSKRDPNDVLEDMRVVLGHNHKNHDVSRGRAIQVSSKKSLDLVASERSNASNEEKSTQRNSNMNVAISKIIELLEGINIQDQEDGVAESHLSSYKSAGYMVRVFQWKTEDLYSTLQKFVQTCNDLLNGAVGLEQFAEQVASNLEWIMSHCFSFRDVSSMRDAIRSHLDCDDSSVSEVESRYVNLCCECSSRRGEDKQPICMISNVDGRNSSSEAAVHHSPRKEAENTNAGDFTEECRPVKQSKNIVEDHIQYKMNEDNEMECKEEAYSDRDVQLKHMTSKDVPSNENNWRKVLQNDWEIAAASEKLAECQETIVNLGKQLKALASPNDAALFSNARSTPPRRTVPSISAPPRKSVGTRTSLLDELLAEDSDPLVVPPRSRKGAHKGNRSDASNTTRIINQEDGTKPAVASLYIAPCRKESKSFFKKLFWRRKKCRRDEVPFS